VPYHLILNAVPASSVFACAPLDVFVFGVWVDLRIIWSQVPLLYSSSLLLSIIHPTSLEDLRVRVFLTAAMF
jgi:hypothetical protein